MAFLRIGFILLAIAVLVWGIIWLGDTDTSEDLSLKESESITDEAVTINGNITETLKDQPVDAEQKPPQSREPVKTNIDTSKIRLSGRVINMAYPGIAKADGPAKNIEIKLTCKENKSARTLPKIKASVMTENDGAFVWTFEDSGIRPLFVHVIIEKDENYRPFHKLIEIQQGERIVSGIECLRYAFGVLSGIVKDDRDNRVAGARIVFSKGGWDGRNLEAVSDAQGSFSIKGLKNIWYPGVTCQGYIPFNIPTPKKIADGGWESMEIILKPSGGLHVHTQDRKGLDLKGRKVSVRLSYSESKAFFSGGAHELETVTDETGLARFENVWSDARLRITIKSGQTQAYTHCKASGDLLPVGKEEPGVPIVIPRGGFLKLIAHEQGSLTIRGKVFFPDKRPVSEPWIKVHDLNEPEWESNRLKLEIPGDEKGNFEIEIPEGEKRSRLSLRAFDKKTSNYRPIFDYAMATVVLTSQAINGILEIDLVLEKTLSISGQVVREDGTPLDCTVRAIPADSSFSMAMDAYGRRAMAESKKDGSFSLNRLAPGNYDLIVTEYLSIHTQVLWFNLANAHHSFPGIEAGTEGHELVVYEKPGVNIRVHAVWEEGEVGEMAVKCHRFSPREPWSTTAATSPHAMNIHSLTNWPAEIPQSTSTYIRSFENAQGYNRYTAFKAKGTSEYTLPQLAEGWHNLGIICSDAQGNSLFPMATGLLYLEPGQYDFYFYLVPTSTFTGRVHFNKPRKNLYAALRDENGKYLLFQLKNKKTVSQVRISLEGRFQLRNAPLGTFTLCIGTAEQLEKGRSLIEKKVHIKAGKNPTLQIQGDK